MIELAIEVAAKAHRNQNRKGKDVPYISHPYIVGMTLLKEGCSDEVVAAGILHDTIEDTEITLDYIRDKFGQRVADIVEGCTEPSKSHPWEERKEHTLEHLKSASIDVRLVTCADKLHNIRTVAQGYRDIGEAVWDVFSRGKEKQEWYYRGLVDVLCNKEDIPKGMKIFDEFKEEVDKVFK